MSGFKSETEESDWTKANLQKLLAAMKTSIPENDRMSAYNKGLKTVDWNKVAFPPFSPEECQDKWREIFQKMRKTRTLTELIVEAEDVISSPFQDDKIHLRVPKRPSPPNAIFHEENWAKFHEKHPKMGRQKLFTFISKKYQALPDEEKAQYVEKFQRATEEYKRKMLEFRKQFHKPPKRGCRTNQKRKRVSADTPDGEQSTDDTEGLPPKPPFNGYNLFCKEQLTSMAGVSKNAYVSVWAQRWRDLTERQRDEYSARCKELKQQYAIELNEYLMTLDKKEQQRILNKHGIKRPKELKGIKRDGTLVNVFPGEPKMPARSGNVIFCKDQMELLKEKFSNSRERFIKVSQLWQDLTRKEKERYKDKVHESITKYSMELQKWFKTLTPAEQKDYRTRNPSKCKYLDAEDAESNDEQMKAPDRKENRTYIPSDSEDEDIEDSSSDDEDVVLESEEDEEDEDGDVLMFEMF